MEASSGDHAPRFGWGLSGLEDGADAAAHACEQARHGLAGERADLALVFASAAHVRAMERVGDAVRRHLGPACLLGVSGESVVGGTTEQEGVPGVAVLAASLPGVRLHAFAVADLQRHDPGTAAGVAGIGEAMGVAPDLRASLLFLDPFSVPLVKLLPAMNRARAEASGSPDGSPARHAGVIVGGAASAASKPGGNAMLLNDRVLRSGGVGVSLLGRLRVDTIVSQGCRPFGPVMVVTKAKGNVILQLGGRPAVEAVRQAVADMREEDRSLLEKGLFIGRVINEYKDRFGRGDFLVRGVVSADESLGAIAVADLVRVGQTVQLHVRDASTAHEDLMLLLDAQQLHGPPAGALLVTCNGRGTRLFEEPGHDARAVCGAFARSTGGEALAKPGALIEAGASGSRSEPGSLPLAGFFAAGEIGPVGDAGESFLHGHTACLALFRRDDD